MNSNTTTNEFKVWAVDNVVYGPVDLSTLQSWVQEERVPADTWVYRIAQNIWLKAGEVEELMPLFAGLNNATSPAVVALGSAGNMRPGSLRRIKIFASFSDVQLTQLLAYLETQEARAYDIIVKQGDPGDAMYFILEGEVRVRLMIGGKETTLVTLNEGEFFGEFCLFDNGPRSADVVANKDTQFLRMSAALFQKMCAESPSLCTPLLLAIAKSMSCRMRADNKRTENLVTWSRASHF